MDQCGSCPCSHHKLGGLVIIILGLLWLLNLLGVLTWNVISIILSVLVIAIGIKKLFIGKCGCCGAGRPGGTIIIDETGEGETDDETDETN